MLTDYVMPIRCATDAYRLKQMVYTVLETAGISVNPRKFLYFIDPLDQSVVVRMSDPRLTAISRDAIPVPQPAIGETYDFCLRASPMHQTPMGKQPTEPAKWFEQRCEEIGIEAIRVYHRTQYTWCGKPTKENMSGFYVPDVTFVGRLQVNDPNKLLHALATGIGRHKAFGFGALQLYRC